MFDMPCVIFAGGKSSRMQRDKTLLPFGDANTLIEFQYNRLKPFFKNIYISTKNSDKFNFKADYIIDDNTDIFAPTIAIKTVFEKLKIDSFLAIAVDTPFITIESISTIINKHNNKFDVTVSYNDGLYHPLFAIYSKSLLSTINEMINQNRHKLNFMIKKSKYQVSEILDNKELININYYDEYKKALNLKL